MLTYLEKDEDVAPSLFASDTILEKRKNSTKDKEVFYPSVWHENKSGNISVLPYACALRTGASYNYQLINGYRRPSSRELLRFQGFPDKFRIKQPPMLDMEETLRQINYSDDWIELL